MKKHMCLRKIAVAWTAAVLPISLAAAVPDLRLLTAVQNHDSAGVRALLKQHVDVDVTQPDGMSALLFAAHNDDLDAVKLLVAAGAKVAVSNRFGLTPITEAAMNGDAEMIELLIGAGADPNTTLEEGDTALMLASRTGNPAAVKVLLDHGSNVNAKEGWHGDTALMWAAGENHAAVVRMLIKAGADVNAQSVKLIRPEMKTGGPGAVYSKYPVGGLTPLMAAARQNSIEAAEALLEGGANQDALDPNKMTALLIAIENAHWDLAHLLIQHGSKIDNGALAAAEDARTAVVVRAVSDHEDKLGSMDIIKELLDKGVKADSALVATIPAKKVLQAAGAPQDATAFYRAARMADLDAMKLFLAKGADAKIKLKDGSTPLIAAAKGRGTANTDFEGGATDEQLAVATKMCIDNGADVNAADNTGTTALHQAASRGADPIVEMLAQNGAKLDLKDKRGRTPLDIAMGKTGTAPPAADGAANSANNGMAMPPRQEPHPSTAALLRKLMGLPEEASIKPGDEAKTDVRN